MENTPETTAVDGGLPRRTVLAGAAWTIPVIAAATITPTASASGTLQLAFDKTTYNGTACSTITGAYVTATTNGVATTGASITVSLSNGYTFSGGSTSATGLSGTNGRYTVPDINVPSRGGNATVQATSSSASATATAQGTPAPATVWYYSYGNLGGIPTNATITAIATTNDDAGGHYGAVLTSDGTLYSSHNGSTFTAGPTNITHIAATDGAVIYSNTNNKVWYYSYGNLGGIPTNATITAIATTNDDAGGHYGAVLTSDGTLYSSHNGSTFTAGPTNITHIAATDGAVIYSNTNNKVWYYSYGNLGGIPTNATITAIATTNDDAGGHYGAVLTSDGTLYSSHNGSTFTAGPTNITHIAATDGAVIYSNTNNKVWYYSYGNLGGIPTNATITAIATTNDDAGGHYGAVLTSDGTLYSSHNGSTFTAGPTNITHIAATDGAVIYSNTEAC